MKLDKICLMNKETGANNQQNLNDINDYGRFIKNFEA